MIKQLVSFLIFLVFFAVSAQAAGILALSTDAPGDPWQAGLQREINRGLIDRGFHVKWRYFTKEELIDPVPASAVLTLLSAEFSSPPDYILVTDPTAYGWIVGVGAPLRGDIPIIFGFSQPFSPLQLLGVSQVTGVVVQPDFYRVIRSALRLNPEATDLMIINNPVGPGKNIKDRFARLASVYRQLTFTFIEGADPKDLQTEAQNWPAGSLVILANSPWIQRGQVVPESFSKHYVIPLYETQLSQGAVGGPVVTIEGLSYHVIEIFNRIRLFPKTAKLPPIWLTAEHNYYLSDQLNQLDIDEPRLSTPFQIIGETHIVYGGWLLSLSLLGCFVLGVLSFYLGYYFLKKLKAEQSLKEVNLSLTSQISNSTEQLEQTFQQVNHELSQRKGAEKALFASEQRFKAFVDHTPVGILVSNPEGRIEYVNKALSQILEVEPEDIEQKKVIDYFPDDLVVFSESPLEPLEQKNHEWPLKNDLGDELMLMSKTAVYYGGDGGSKGITFVLDITELKRIETRLRSANTEAQSAVKAKAEFLATMSHEIRTPLNSVIGMSSLLRQTTLDDEQIDLVESVIGSGENLLAILNGILDYSKIEAGRMDIDDSPVNLLSMVDKVIQILIIQAEPKGLQLDFHVSTDLPPTVQLDEMRLSQVLVNLVGNAVKFTSKGHVSLKVSLKPDEQRIKFEIKDTGIGISSEDQEMLFEAFHQVDSSLSRKFGGTGLGLAICRELVGLMGGKISVYSDGVKGSNFCFSLPLKKIKGPMKPFEAGMIPSFLEKRILWISDNLPRTGAILDWTESWGARVTVASSSFWNPGLLSHHWDLVILDRKLEALDQNTLWLDIEKHCKAPRLRFVSSLEGKRGDELLTTPFHPKWLFDKLEKLWVQPKGAKENRVLRIYPELARSYPMSILIADDNPLNLKLTMKMLQKMGYQADTAKNGQEAVDLVMSHSYHLVLMDIQMPVLDGIAAVREIWARLETKRPKCVALTANASADDLLHYQTVGFDDTLIKPLMPEVFVDHITMWGQFFAKQQHSNDLA